MIAKAGDTLTIAHDIIGASGVILFQSDQKVKIRKVCYRGGHYASGMGGWIDKQVTGVLLEETSGEWFPSCFKEDITEIE